MRRTTALLIALLLTAPGWAATTLKIATLAPDGTAWMREMRAAGDQIAARSDGRVELKFYPGGVMGNFSTVMRKMRVGQLHGGAFTGGDLATIYPDMYLITVPFLYQSLEEVAFVREALDPKLEAGLAERGIELLGIAGGGFAYIMSTEPVASQKDLERVKFWQPEGDEVARMALEKAGVAPIPLPLSDVYTGLQTSLIDTVVNTPVGAIAFQWHTRLKTMTDLPVSFVTGAMALDKRAFDRLDAADQAIVKEVVGATMARLEAMNIADNVGARQALVNQGITIVDPEASELARWRELGPETIATLRAGELPMEHLDLIEERIRLFRAQAAR